MAPFRPHFDIKRLKDGRAMINLGCGTRMHWAWNNIDFSPYARLVHHMGVANILRSVGFLSEKRFQRLLRVDPQILFWDLRKGIPFNDNTFDVVYHSHFLEHLDKTDAPVFLKECHRILKWNGIIRIVLPDFQSLINQYMSAISCLENGDRFALHQLQKATDNLLNPMVRKQIAGTQQQPFLVQLVERFIRGHAGNAGELHRWMYDKYSIAELLLSVGFNDIRTETPTTSRIKGWDEFTLDHEETGTIYKRGSLYIEGKK